MRKPSKPQRPKDNTTLPRKVLLRRRALAELIAAGVVPIVLETHAGYGHIWQQCYRDVADGVAFDKDAAKAAFLVTQRPTWAVYGGDCVAALRDGAGAHLPVNLLDLDPYGEPWSALDAFLESERPRPDVLAIVVNDGLRQNVNRGGAWHVPALAEMVPKYGNAKMHREYLAVCQELVRTKTAQAGYRLGRWSGYYTGFHDQMTHYLAICRRVD